MSTKEVKGETVMSSVEEFNYGLDQLSERVDQHVESMKAVSEDPRFNSIAVRSRRAGELATELAGFIRGILDDTDAYVASLVPLDRTGEECQDLVAFAQTIVADTNKEALAAVPNDIGKMSAFAVGGLIGALERSTRPFAAYLTTAERAGSGLSKLAEILPDRKQEAAERAEVGAAKIKETIQQSKV